MIKGWITDVGMSKCLTQCEQKKHNGDSCEQEPAETRMDHTQLWGGHFLSRLDTCPDVIHVHKHMSGTCSR